MKISHFAVRHSAVLSMVLIALALFGVFSLYTTNLEFIPDINMPQIFVISVYPGAGAEDVSVALAVLREVALIGARSDDAFVFGKHDGEVGAALAVGPLQADAPGLAVWARAEERDVAS